MNRTLENAEAEADQRSTDTSEDQEDHDEELPLISGMWEIAFISLTWDFNPLRLMAHTYVTSEVHATALWLIRM